MFYQLGEDSVNVKQPLACQTGTCVTQGPLPSREATGTVLLPGVVGTHFGARLLQVRDPEAGRARSAHGAIIGPTAHISVQDPVRRRCKLTFPPVSGGTGWAGRMCNTHRARAKVQGSRGLARSYTWVHP